MTTDFDFSSQELFGPVVFRPSFNQAEAISANQAWSLFFTAGQEDKKLGFNAEAGRLFTNLLVATAVSGVIGAAIFTSIG
ncbi:MAG: hypothetical protein HC929_22370 [Leptolyngbyaceae cyanobacterium SM2_5_2]|nr:hypothetical protein [Leptolyngbyaceae cyanobacterium SM2_5_2]